jgi:RimJ/RimL family protein N-acetyltransferase
MNPVIRPATRDDAAALIALLRENLAEPGNLLLLEPHEFTFTLEQEREYIAAFQASPNSTLLVADVAGELVASLSCRGGSRVATRHCGTIGIMVAAAWRDRGIGRAMIEEVIAWAKDTGLLTRLDLSVLDGNDRAVHLYRKLGFQIEGRQRAAVYKHGRYIDNLLMGLPLDENSTR